ncbi:MAG TPA: solute carrier family 23 protein, partial [Burkholderiales bacterium]|nr:solute carrier family 23 protein [Burkholderiales bacterium]
GISLFRVAINWAAGGQPTIRDAATGQMIANPNYGALENLAVAAIVMVTILLIVRYMKGFFANVSVLLGIIVGFIIALLMGKVSFHGIEEQAWVALVYPFQFGLPKFDVVAILTMCLVMIVVMIESLGMFLALGDITGKPVTKDDLTRGLRVDGLGTLIGGIFNTFPYTSFSQNVGLVGVTGVRSRWVCTAGGVILIAFGLFPKMAHAVASVPVVCARWSGNRDVRHGRRHRHSDSDRGRFTYYRFNLYVVAISIGVGMIPLVAPTFFHHMPKALEPLLHSGILLTAITAVVLNAYFHGVKSAEEARGRRPRPLMARSDFKQSQKFQAANKSVSRGE